MKTEMLKQTILEAINKSGVSIDVLYYLIKDIFHEVEKAYIEAVRKEVESSKDAASEASEDKKQDQLEEQQEG